MKAPDLNRALTLQGAIRASDGAGGFSQAWEALGVLWAEVAPGSGRDVPGEELILSAVPYRIVIRSSPHGAPSRPVPGHRFVEGDRIFSILALAERGAGGRYLTCFCREELPK